MSGVVTEQFLERSFDDPRFLGCERPREQPFGHERYAALCGRISSVQSILRQMSRGFDERRIVQRRQGLERRVGPFATDGTHFAAGRVEDIEERWRSAALPEGVQTAAVQVLALVRLI